MICLEVIKIQLMSVLLEQPWCWRNNHKRKNKSTT